MRCSRFRSSLLWLSSPSLACWVSQPSRVAESQPVSDVDAAALRLVARRAWHYFETFVTAADNMLPPDNFQEEPWPVLAHRTSPTNLGLYLLSIVTARDLGWVGTIDAVERLESTLATMSRLEQCHGHFYNWYDTQDLRPLEPQYVSSVDSGNLAGAPAHAGQCLRRNDSRVSATRRRSSPVSVTARAGPRESLGMTVDTRLAAALAAFGNELSDRTARSEPLAASLDALASRAGAVVALIAQLAGERRQRGQCRDRRVGRGHAPFRSRATCATWCRARDGGAIHCRSASLRWRRRRVAWRTAMRFDFLFDHERKLLSIGYRVARGQPRSELLRPARVRGAAGELRRDRQGRRPGAALVPPRARRDVRVRHGAALSRGPARCSNT